LPSRGTREKKKGLPKCGSRGSGKRAVQVPKPLPKKNEGGFPLTKLPGAKRKGRCRTPTQGKVLEGGG